MNINIGNYRIIVPDSLGDTLKNELNGWEMKWLEKRIKLDPIEVRSMIAHWLDIDIAHVIIDD